MAKLTLKTAENRLTKVKLLANHYDMFANDKNEWMKGIDSKSLGYRDDKARLKAEIELLKSVVKNLRRIVGK